VKVIAFPKYIEVDSLLMKYNIIDSNVEKKLIKEAISAVRKTHGVFLELHFNAVIQLLAHDWLPSDIPVLLPAPASDYFPLDLNI